MFAFDIAAICPDPPEIDNGKIEPISDKEYYFGDIPQCQCNSGYSLGTADIKCGAVQETAHWEGTLPRCECELIHLFGVGIYPIKGNVCY